MQRVCPRVDSGTAWSTASPPAMANPTRSIVWCAVAVAAAAAAACVGLVSAEATCPEKVLENTGLGGGSTVSGLINVSTMADCECVCVHVWVWVRVGACVTCVSGVACLSLNVVWSHASVERMCAMFMPCYALLAVLTVTTATSATRVCVHAGVLCMCTSYKRPHVHADLSFVHSHLTSTHVRTPHLSCMVLSLSTTRSFASLCSSAATLTIHASTRTTMQ
jgi:hypothetical protein